MYIHEYLIHTAFLNQRMLLCQAVGLLKDGEVSGALLGQEGSCGGDRVCLEGNGTSGDRS